MRQIKKLLALVLALVMSLSLVTVSTSAALTEKKLTVPTGVTHTVTKDETWESVTVKEGGFLVLTTGDLTSEDVTINGTVSSFKEITAENLTIGATASVQSAETSKITATKSASINTDKFTGEGKLNLEAPKENITVGADVNKSKLVAVAEDSDTASKITDAKATAAYKVTLDKTSAAAGDKITATVKDNTGTEITSGVSYSWKIDSTEVSTTASYTVKEADAGKTITVSAKVGDVEAASAELTVKAAEEEDDGKYDLTITYDELAPVNTTATKLLHGANKTNVTTNTTVANTTGTTFAAEGVIDKDGSLKFEVTEYTTYDVTVKVTVGGEEVTPTKLSTTGITVTYQVDGIAGDVVVTTSAAKKGTADLVFINTTLDAAGTNAKVYVSHGGATTGTSDATNGAEQVDLAKLTAVTVGAAKKYTVSIDVGDTVYIVGDKLPSSGTIKLADGVFGEGMATNTVKFTMPANGLTIGTVNSTALKQIVYDPETLTITGKTSADTAKITAGEKAGEIYVPADGSVTLAVNKPYIVVAAEDTVQGSTLKKATDDYTPAADGATEYVKAASKVTLTNVDAATDSASPVTITNNYVAVGTKLTIKAKTGYGTAVIKYNTPTGSETEPVSAAEDATAKAGTPYVVTATDTTFAAAVKLTCGDGVSAKYNDEAVSTYVVPGLDISTDKADATDKLLITAASGTPMIVDDADSVTGAAVPSTVGTEDMVIKAGIQIKSEAAIRVELKTGTDTKKTISANLTEAAAAVVPGATVIITGATINTPVVAKLDNESKTDISSKLVADTENNVTGNKFKYTLDTTGLTEDVVLTEGTVAALTITESSGNAVILKADLAQISTLTELAETLHDIDSNCTGTPSGNYAKITKTTGGSLIAYADASNLKTVLKGLTENATVEYGYYKITVKHADGSEDTVVYTTTTNSADASEGLVGKYVTDSATPDADSKFLDASSTTADFSTTFGASKDITVYDGYYKLDGVVATDVAKDEAAKLGKTTGTASDITVYYSTTTTTPDKAVRVTAGDWYVKTGGTLTVTVKAGNAQAPSESGDVFTFTATGSKVNGEDGAKTFTVTDTTTADDVLMTIVISEVGGDFTTTFTSEQGS